MKINNGYIHESFEVVVDKECLEAAQSMSDCPVLHVFIKPVDSSNSAGPSTRQSQLMSSLLLSCTCHCNPAVVKARLDY